MVIETEYPANHKISKALAVLEIPHSEHRLDANRVVFVADLDEDDAKALVHLALEATFG
jgi:hypothetical protein